MFIPSGCDSFTNNTINTNIRTNIQRSILRHSIGEAAVTLCQIEKILREETMTASTHRNTLKGKHSLMHSQ